MQLFVNLLSICNKKGTHLPKQWRDTIFKEASVLVKCLETEIIKEVARNW